MEAAALSANGDSRDGRQEQGSLRTITGGPEHVQGQGQGRSQRQDVVGDDTRPVTDTDPRNPSRCGRMCSRSGRVDGGGRDGRAYGALYTGQG